MEKPCHKIRERHFIVGGHIMIPARSIKLKEIKDLDNLPQGVEYLVTTEDILNYPGRFCSFYKQDNFLTILEHRKVKFKDEPEYLALDQFDAPLEILPWFVDKFDFFFKPASQGGLPAGKIATDKELVGGEYILLISTMYAGNARREGGYSIQNLSGYKYNRSRPGKQSILISGSYMFQGGFLDTWKMLAEKYENGTL